MKKILTAACMTAAMFFLAGCPYESSIPIDKPAVKTDPALLGTWKEKKNNDVYVVGKKDDFTYSIKQEDENLRAFISMVNGVSFLNLWEPKFDGSTEKYLLFKIEMQDDESILLTEVTDNIRESFTSSDDLKKFISANMNNSYFFGKGAVQLVRVRN